MVSMTPELPHTVRDAEPYYTKFRKFVDGNIRGNFSSDCTENTAFKPSIDRKLNVSKGQKTANGALCTLTEFSKAFFAFICHIAVRI
jgi:hypothetical protein